MEPENYHDLTTEEVQKKYAEYGFNEIREKKVGVLVKFAKWFVSPIVLMLLAAAGLSWSIGRVFDFYFILFLALLNFFVGFWQERKADNAIEKLSQKLAVKVKVLRDGTWQWLDSKYIVPDDIVDLNMGDIVPADVEILESRGMSVNEAALTGESLPKDKETGDKCFSGSFVTIGWGRTRVLAIGKDTYFGKILISIDKTYHQSLLEKDILSISKWLAFLSIIAVAFLTLVFLWQHRPFAEILTLDLSLIIAGIPISLPTVMALIISFGVLNLARKKTIVRRLSALEEMANVNLLLSDKTGTLTKNKITVERIIAYPGYSEDEVLRLATFTTRENDHNPINLAVRRKAESLRIDTVHETIDLIPFDSVRKRSTVKVVFQGKELRVRTGAPQVIASFCNMSSELSGSFDTDVAQSAEKGYRAVAVAVKDYANGANAMTLAGLLFFSDTPEEGAAETIQFIKKNGIQIKMLSGDNIAIARRIAQDLGIEGRAVNKKMLGKDFKDLSAEEFESIGTFAEILPDDKYDLVHLAQGRYLVAVTGDGINDLPALEAANVSIAVRNSVDALKGAADFVLTESGISVIRDAVIESRKIFSRLYAYSVYRISESFRVIATATVLGVMYGIYPLQPIQIILLALLNDIPIISLAFNRVKVASEPSQINAKARLILSSLFGFVGIINSLLLVGVARNVLQYDWDTIQTLFFLKLAVSGHMLIYVSHTKERWWRYLPSKQVIWATFLTQVLATVLALTGLFMHKVSFGAVLFVWVWAIFWMQVSELMKDVNKMIRFKKSS